MTTNLVSRFKVAILESDTAVYQFKLEWLSFFQAYYKMVNSDLFNAHRTCKWLMLHSNAHNVTNISDLPGTLAPGLRPGRLPWIPPGPLKGVPKPTPLVGTHHTHPLHLRRSAHSVGPSLPWCFAHRNESWILQCSVLPSCSTRNIPTNSLYFQILVLFDYEILHPLTL